MADERTLHLARQVFADATNAHLPLSPLCVILVGEMKTKGLRGAALRRAMVPAQRARDAVIDAARAGGDANALRAALSSHHQTAGAPGTLRIVEARSAEELVDAWCTGPPGDAVDWIIAGRAVVISKWWDSNRARSEYNG